MKSIAVNPLLLCLGSLCLLLPSIAARSRPTIDDRIVFPKDSDEDGFASKFLLPSVNSTTSETPVTTSSTPLTTSNTTELISGGSEEQLVNGTSTSTSTQKPVVDNRILIDTSPKCREGYELRANRCRQSA